MTFLVSTNPIVTISGSTPITATEGVTPTISIQDSTIDQKGAIQLEDSFVSTSIVKAATPNSVREAYDYATTVSNTLQLDIDSKASTLLELPDTPSIYEEGEYLRSTTSGVEWTIPEAESIIIRVKEENTSSITKGQVCAIVGSSGVKATACLCDCDNTDKVRNIGLAQNDIPQNENGIIVYKGSLEGVDTRITNSGINPYGEIWTPGNLLWTSNTPGGLTKVRPTSGRSIKAARTVKGNNTSDVLIVITHVNPVWATTAADEDIVLRVGDSAGANKVSIRNYDNDEIADFDSYGNLTVSGTGSFTTVDTHKIIECVKSHNITTSGIETFDLNDGSYHTVLVNNDFEVTFSNWSTVGKMSSITTKLINAGAYNIIWPGVVDWPGGVEPSWTSVSGVDFAVFFSDDGGMTIYGNRTLTDMK